MVRNDLPYFQQGDVLLKRYDMNTEGSGWEDRRNRERKPKKVDELTVAFGENSGHSHRVKKTGKKQIIHYVHPYNNNIVFELEEDAVIEHEEHGPIVLPAGTYIVETVREVDHFGGTTRGVVD